MVSEQPRRFHIHERLATLPDRPLAMQPRQPTSIDLGKLTIDAIGGNSANCCYPAYYGSDTAAWSPYRCGICFEIVSAGGTTDRSDDDDGFPFVRRSFHGLFVEDLERWGFWIFVPDEIGNTSSVTNRIPDAQAPS